MALDWIVWLLIALAICFLIIGLVQFRRYGRPQGGTVMDLFARSLDMQAEAVERQKEQIELQRQTLDELRSLKATLAEMTAKRGKS